MQTQSEFENSVLENSGVDEHSHTGVLGDSVRDKVCSRCVPCPFPPITADPTSQDTLVYHVELSWDRSLGGTSLGGTPQHLPRNQVVCGVVTSSSLGSPLVPGCWWNPLPPSRVLVFRWLPLRKPWHLPGLPSVLATCPLYSQLGYSTPARESVSLHIAHPPLRLLWAVQTQSRIISLWVIQIVIKLTIWLTQPWSHLQNPSCQMMGQNSGCGIHIMYGPRLHTSLD